MSGGDQMRMVPLTVTGMQSPPIIHRKACKLKAFDLSDGIQKGEEETGRGWCRVGVSFSGEKDRSVSAERDLFLRVAARAESPIPRRSAVEGSGMAWISSRVNATS